MEEKKYKVMPVIRRLMKNLYERDRRQLPRTCFYTIAAGIYPFLAVFLPKLAIGILEKNGGNAAVKLAAAMLIYLAVAGVLGYSMNRLQHIIESANMRMRLRYLGDIGSKLMCMDYKYVEDSSF